MEELFPLLLFLLFVAGPAVFRWLREQAAGEADESRPPAGGRPVAFPVPAPKPERRLEQRPAPRAAEARPVPQTAGARLAPAWEGGAGGEGPARLSPEPLQARIVTGAAPAAPEAAPAAGWRGALGTRAEVRRAIVLAEVLGPPRSRRRGR